MLVWLLILIWNYILFLMTAGQNTNTSANEINLFVYGMEKVNRSEARRKCLGMGAKKLATYESQREKRLLRQYVRKTLKGK